MSDYWPEPVSGNSSGAGSRTTPLSSSAVWDSVRWACDRDQANWQGAETPTEKNRERRIT